MKITTVSPVEAAFLSKLQHTNIVPIYSLHKALGLQAICMPFYGRYTLAHRLSAGAESAASIDEARAVEITLQIAHGLAHAHERGIVHRDLKPANVLLADDGTAMILDFNLSDDVIAGGKSCLMVGGTLPYLAPEHLAAIRAGHRVGKQADIFSLGTMLYQMLCRKLPFPPRRSVVRCDRGADDCRSPDRSVRTIPQPSRDTWTGRDCPQDAGSTTNCEISVGGRRRRRPRPSPA